MPICVDDRGALHLYLLSHLRLRLPFTFFEKELLTELNVAPCQLHPNAWGFIRAFEILCNHFGHPPSTDVFLYFFEAKNPGDRLMANFMKVFLNHVRYGAEAMYECVQDPPKSGVDLEGA